MGFVSKDLTDEQKKARQTNVGVQIATIIHDSPAERADLMEDDIIESIDGKRIANNEALGALFYVPGQTLKLVITRGNKQLEKTLIADEQASSPRS